MRLTWIRQRFGRDALCEQYHTADVDQILIWRGTLCEQQYAADVDRAMVEQLLNPMPCHRKSIQSNSMISQFFDAALPPSGCGPHA